MEGSRVPHALGLGEVKVRCVRRWAQRVVEERGKEGLYAGVLLCLTSLSGLFSGFCMGFFFADLVWFLTDLYIFSVQNSVNGRKQRNKKI